MLRVSVKQKKVNVGFWIEPEVKDLSSLSSDDSFKWITHIVRGAVALPYVNSICLCCPSGREDLLSRVVDFKHEKVQVLGLKTLDAFVYTLNDVSDLDSRRDKLEVAVEKAKMRWKPNSIESDRRFPMKRVLERRLESIAIFAASWSGYQLARLVGFFKKRFSNSSFRVRFDEDLGDAKPSVWIVANPAWTGAGNLPGDRYLIIPEVDFTNGLMLEQTNEWIESLKTFIRTNLETSKKIICFSHEVANSQVKPLLASDRPVHVLKHGVDSSLPECAVSKTAMADLLREKLRTHKLNRHFCDFPFENVDYIFIGDCTRTVSGMQYAITAYEQLLRRYRLNCKLFVNSDLDSNPVVSRLLHSRGLVFDVFQTPPLDRTLYASLIKHAKCLLVPDRPDGVIPISYYEAATLGTPVAMCKTSINSGVYGESTWTGREFFHKSDPHDIAECVRYVLENQDEVRKTQFEQYMNLADRNWSAVAEELLS